MTFITYSAQEAAEKIGIDRHLLPMMHELGMLLGIKTGRGRRYSETELEEFWQEYIGEDISSAEKIRIVATLHRKRHGKQAEGGKKR